MYSCSIPSDSTAIWGQWRMPSVQQRWQHFLHSCSTRLLLEIFSLAFHLFCHFTNMKSCFNRTNKMDLLVPFIWYHFFTDTCPWRTFRFFFLVRNGGAYTWIFLSSSCVVKASCGHSPSQRYGSPNWQEPEVSGLIFVRYLFSCKWIRNMSTKTICFIMCWRLHHVYDDSEGKIHSLVLPSPSFYCLFHHSQHLSQDVVNSTLQTYCVFISPVTMPVCLGRIR